ncbi:hypothetical protein PoMZ_09321 [Pyricularia oryzae]|uniref:Uncharacterized protein n=1 Tax=Pyricularia oryzae TaxID=318829 RepID=A0A4P7MU12_PYROR|nr:hypothetical protein PoMZ_09321 [Pyricularia oryzae]
MKFIGFTTLLVLWVFTARILAADTYNYQIASIAAAEAGVDLGAQSRSKYFAFYEEWASHNLAEQCASGLSHVRLVVGKVVVRRDRDSTRDFQATTYDLIKGTQGWWCLGLYGGETSANHDTGDWYANHYIKDGQWKRVSVDNNHRWAGEVRKLPVSEMKKIGEAYCNTYRTYNAYNNNCITFAENLFNNIRV